MTTTDALLGGSELGATIRATDWAATPLGEPQGWPPSLRSAASICLSSRFPIAIYWGSELALLYNAAWSPILGEKHPWAFGKPGRAVWPEIWAEIGPLFETVHRSGEGVWQQDQLLPMHRHGYTEECYFNFTFSPIRGEDGSIAGIFNAVIETTFRVLEERRARLLRDLSERSAGARSAREACECAAAALNDSPADLPFCMLYLREEGAPAFQLVAAAGAALPTQLRPPALDPADPAAPWPLAEPVASGRPALVDDLAAHFGVTPPRGIWPEPIRRAIVIPIAGGQTSGPAGLLVAGISPRRALDDAYRTFLERVAQQVATAIGIADAYEAERRRAEALAAIDEAKTAFFSNVSHEFRTPLTLLLSPLEDILARPDALAPASRAGIEVAHRNALRLLKLVNTLLDFARIEAGRARAAYEPIDLGPFTTELASVFRSAIERARLRLLVDCPSLPAPAFVDREMWEKIVFNLLSNALKFTFEGEIAVTLRHTGALVELAVRDTGTGIPADELPHLFERFHRVQGSRGRTIEGSGIGLALVQELAKLHGGEVRATSVLGQGSTFTVCIPAGAAHLPAERITPPQPASSPLVRGEVYVEEALRWLPEVAPATARDEGATDAAQARPATARILLADDNADMRDYVRRLLSPLYEVVAVGDGVAAIREARAAPFDLVLSDVMMPNLDGFGVLHALRADPRTRELPVVLLSARAGEEARVEGMEAGADDYLVKPFSARELLARVGAHLEIARVRRKAARRERELRAEAQAARAQLEQVLAGVADQFLVLDTEWRYVFLNDHVTTTMALPREQLLGRSIWELFPDLVGTNFEREARQAMATQLPARFEYYYPRQERWFENRVYPAPSGLALFVADVTERKRAEEALRDVNARRLAEEQEHAARLQRLNAASLAINAAPTRDTLLGRITAEARALLGARRAALTLIPGGDWARAQTIGAPEPDDQPGLAWPGAETLASLVCERRQPVRLAAAELAALGAADAPAQQPGASQAGETASAERPIPGVPTEVPGTRLAGTELLAAPLLARDGTCIAAILLAGRPAAPFGAADEALLQQLAQMAAVALENRTLYEQEQAARAQAEEASRLKDEFLATVSHELRTPLTALLGYAQLLQSRKRDEVYVARTVEKIARSARAQAQITEDLLDIGRIVSGKLRIDPRPIDLIAVILAALETVRPAVEAKGLHLSVDLRPEAGAIVGDAERLQQVVWNLLANAAKFTHPGGRITVRLERDGDEAQLTVADDGQGISPAFLPFVFDRFRQADSSSHRTHGGLGLGLAIVRHLVELHGGSVAATSPGLGEGATFTVRLPLARGLGLAAPTNADHTFPDEPEPCPPELRGLRVLLVDDQPEILELLDETLTPCGAVVQVCTTAREALAALAGWRPDLLVSDIAMPGEDGYWLIRSVRALSPEQGGATPAVALTAYVRMEDRLKVLAAGFQQYVPKPVEPAELRAVLAGMVRA